MIIGLTGQTGAGKSIVCEVFSKKGIKVIDCDKISREVTKNNSPVLEKISQKFEGVVKNGVLDRQSLGKIVFSSPQKKAVLESILFPEIVKRVKGEILGEKTVIIDAPTLFESGLNEICDKTLAVVADDQKRLSRIVLRDGIDESGAKLRMSAQHTAEWFKNNCDAVIENDGSKNEFIKRVDEVLLKWNAV